MLVKAALLKMRIAESPATLSPDLRGRPPHLRPWRDGWRHLRFLMMLSPAWLFILPGVIGGLAGLGILAAAGACWRLRELVGASVAKQVLLAGRRLDADDALRFGLVAEVVPAGDLLKRAHALHDRMARSGPLALRLTKLVADGAGHPLTDDLAQAILFESEEKRVRMDAFLAGGYLCLLKK